MLPKIYLGIGVSFVSTNLVALDQANKHVVENP